MLLWINGPFGGGKTQTAHEIQRRLPTNSVICDPEEVGFGLRRMTPSYLRHDFQDYPAWRQGVFEVLDHVLSNHVGVVIAPMTIVEPNYYEETIGQLRSCGHDVRHLRCSPTTGQCYIGCASEVLDMPCSLSRGRAPPYFGRASPYQSLNSAWRV